MICGVIWCRLMKVVVGDLAILVSEPLPSPKGLACELSKRLHCEQVSKCPKNYSKSNKCSSALTPKVCSSIYDFSSSKFHIFILSN